LENSIPYCGDLHIDAVTKKLILNLLSSIESVIQVAGPPGPDFPEHREEHINLDYIRNIIVYARQHYEELEGLFNPDELFRYTLYVADYQDIMTQLEIILEKLTLCRDSALNFAGALAEMVEGHLQMTGKVAEVNDCGDSDADIHIRHEGIKLKVV